MPELIEVEQYKRALEPLVGERVDHLEVIHPGFMRPRGAPPGAFTVLEGGRLEATRRLGKVLLLDVGCDGELVPVGLRFGMTGMLFVNGVGPIDQLEYASSRTEPAWDRLRLHIGGSIVSIRDQRRLGSVELEPDLGALGPDAQYISADALVNSIGGTQRAIKTVLLDQSALAGLGNLLADEVLWRSGIAPSRSARDLGPTDVEMLAATIREVIAELTVRGGSHTGDSFEHRVLGAECPSCDGSMRRSRIGGRTAWWCPKHQR